MRIVTVLIVLLGMTACVEKRPVIGPLGGGSDSARKVLIEEFTGVRCTNCPDGSAEILNLQALHGENLIAVSIHAGPFSEPYPENQYDFRTATGDALLQLLGEPLGYPSAVIDRKIFPGESGRPIGKAQWPGYIQSELAEAPLVNVAIETTYKDADRSLHVRVTVVPLEDIAEPLKLSVLLTEDNIVDVQAFPSGLDPGYTHRHVLRDRLMAEVSGLAIGDHFVKGQSQSFDFDYTLPTNWKANDCHIVAFVHKAGPDLDVLQVEEHRVTE